MDKCFFISRIHQDQLYFVLQIYGPSRHDDYGSKSFPGVDDAIEEARKRNTAESWQSVQHEVWRVSRVIRHASLVLQGQLT